MTDLAETPTRVHYGFIGNFLFDLAADRDFTLDSLSMQCTESSGQVWAGGDRSKPLVPDATQACFACHTPQKAQDYTFSTYIPRSVLMFTLFWHTGGVSRVHHLPGRSIAQIDSLVR